MLPPRNRGPARGLLLAFTAPVIACAAAFQVESNTRRSGEALVRELGCVRCHPAEGALAARAAALPGPELRGIGALVAPDALHARLTRGGGSGAMPDLLHGLSADARTKAAEDLVHFLESTGDPWENRGVGVPQAEADEGKNLYRRIGCIPCHGDAEAGVKGPVLLDGVSVKYTVPGLTRFLADPLRWRPSGRMPSFRLTGDEARALAAHLLRSQAVPGATAPAPGLEYALYTGTWDALPDFGRLAPVETGRVRGLELPLTRPADHFGVVYRGSIHVARAGLHRFALSSDDGSEIWIDGRRVVSNDGLHATLGRAFEVELTAGAHAFEARYFEKDGGEALFLDVIDDAGARSKAPLELFTFDAPAHRAPGAAAFEVDAARAEAGRHAFDRFRCAACHPLTGTAAEPARRLAELDLAARGGCLSESPAAAAPKYALPSADRAAIRGFLERARREASPLTAAERVTRVLTELRCTACHKRSGVGAPLDEHVATFATNGEAELGDEGRIPPTLTGVGAKLNPTWIEKVLLHGASVRPYMALRMPQFGPAPLSGLTNALVEADGADVDAPPLPDDAALVEDGRHLTGTGAFSCITCHLWGGNPSLGIPALDLTTSRERLRPRWFERYLLDPEALRPGTRMPRYFTDGRSPIEGILGGDASKQIRALWAYLALGNTAAPPRGSKSADELELVPDTETIVLRTFLEGAGVKAIAVGTRHGLHYAFDPENLRLTFAWRGRFLSAEPAWAGRAGRYAKPLGAPVAAFPEGPSVAIVNGVDAPWPSARGGSGRWIGYRTGRGTEVTFDYRIGPVRVAETIDTRLDSRGVSLTRTWVFESAEPAEGLAVRMHSLGDGPVAVTLIQGTLRDAPPPAAERAPDTIAIRLRDAGAPGPRRYRGSLEVELRW